MRGYGEACFLLPRACYDEWTYSLPPVDTHRILRSGQADVAIVPGKDVFLRLNSSTQANLSAQDGGLHGGT